jgi:hypothetical protein
VRAVTQVNSIRPRYAKALWGQRFQRQGSPLPAVKNGRKQLPVTAGVVGDGAYRKIDRGTWETRQVGGTQRDWEDITRRWLVGSRRGS